MAGAKSQRKSSPVHFNLDPSLVSHLQMVATAGHRFTRQKTPIQATTCKWFRLPKLTTHVAIRVGSQTEFKVRQRSTTYWLCGLA
jgi:hypothetical protein